MNSPGFLSDVPDIGALVGADAELMEITLDFSTAISVPARQALRVRKGSAVVRGGFVLPVVNGATCTAAFQGNIVAEAPSSPRAHLKDAVLLAGSPQAPDFLAHTFGALLFVRYIAGSPANVHLAQALPSTLESLVGELLPLLAGGRPAAAVPLPDGSYSVEECIFPVGRTPTPFAAIFARRTILPFAMSRIDMAGGLAGNRTVKIFLRGAPGYAPVNEDVLAAWFVARGYVAIDVASLPVVEQIVLFSRATHIAATDGPALVHLLFAVRAHTIIVFRRAGAGPALALQDLTIDSDAAVLMVEGSADFTVPLERLEALDRSLF